MRGKLPDSVLNRKKTGFDIPAHDWFRGALRGTADGHADPEAVAATGIFDAARDPGTDTRSYGEADQCRISPMGPADAFPVDEEMEGRSLRSRKRRGTAQRARVRYQLIVALVAALIFVGCMISPPSLMDDVDAVQAQIARNMLQSGDWVTARLDGVAYLEKSPLKYWMIAVSFMIFGVHDWAARIPDGALRRCCCAG